MSEPKSTLLVVEDDLDIAEMLCSYFKVQGYEVLSANWGEDAVKTCLANPPDLVILDIRLPDIDGFEVARRLRASRRTAEIPVIFLTEKRERQDRLKGLELKAEDYITKPFDIQELRLRVRNALRRNTQGSLTNPITTLPQGSLVDERLRECLHESLHAKNWAMLVITLDHLDKFREVYGFVASDDLLRASAMMLRDSLREVGDPTDFLGHLGPAAFIMVVNQPTLAPLKEKIRKRLETSLDYFYRDQDRQSGVFDGKHLAVCTRELTANQPAFDRLEAMKEHLERLARGD